MTINEAKKLKTGDKVVIKECNRIIEIAKVSEKYGCSGRRKFVEIAGANGGIWTHKQISALN